MKKIFRLFRQFSKHEKHNKHGEIEYQDGYDKRIPFFLYRDDIISKLIALGDCAVLRGWFMKSDLSLDKCVVCHIGIVGFTDVHRSVSIIRERVIHNSIVVRKFKQPKSVDRLIVHDISPEGVKGCMIKINPTASIVMNRVIDNMVKVCRIP